MEQPTSFSDMNLTKPVQAALDELGFETPTPVQAQAIPAGLTGADVLAAAQTGTGKTIAFLLPIFDGMVRHWGSKCPKGAKGPYVLILTPTRELATQITEVAQILAKHCDFRVMNVIGGVKYEKQIKGFKSGCDVLIATPGRLKDLVAQKAASLKNVRYLVLDEVDRMVDMGFWPSVSAICSEVPTGRQTFLFSATLTPLVNGKAKLLMREPVRVEIAQSGETAETVDEFLCPISFQQKRQLMLELLKEQGADRVLVFVPTKNDADACALVLKRAGIKTDSIHAGKPQGKRDAALRKFREGKIDVLVATDVLARGIDINEVSYVINLTVPKPPEDYVHRIGRTGRAGVAGRAYTFMSPDQLLDLREIEYFTGKLLEIHDVEGFPYDNQRLMPDPTRSAKRGAKKTTRRFGGLRRR